MKPTPAHQGRPGVLVLLGAPGSGKSSWIRTHADQLGVVVLSTDTTRAMLGAGEHDQSVDAHRWVRARAHEHMTAGDSVVIDATGYCARDRALWLDLAHHHYADATAVRFRTSLRRCLARNRRRDRTVPRRVVVRMWLRLRCTTDRRLRQQGFSTITTPAGLCAR